MAMSIQSRENSRFTDLFDEPIDHLLSPIKGYQDKPLVSLAEAVKPISGFFNEIEDNIYVALHNCQKLADELTQEESASIHLYTMQFNGGPSLYLLLNQSLRAENREQLKPWFSFLKLFLTALHKLPSQTKIVWRGVRDIDLSSKYKTGTKFAWWGVSSCTTNIEVLESSQFLGKTGQRTLFSIECVNGKSVVNHSYYKNTEKEIILMPGSYFEVIGKLNPAPELHIIQLQEISPPITLVKSPFSKSTDTDPSSVVDKPNTFSLSSSNTNIQTISSKILSKGISLKPNSKWKQHGITVAGGNGSGNELNQLNSPRGIRMDDNQSIYIADYMNGRIVEWKPKANNGRIVAGGNERGTKTNQLWGPTDAIIDKQNDFFIICDSINNRVMRWPRQNNTNGQIIISDIDCFGVVIDDNGYLYVSDSDKNEVRRWKIGDKHGTIVAGGNGKGNHLNQFNEPTFIFVDQDYSVYVSDLNNHRVMKWPKDTKEGIVVAGGNGQGNNLSQLDHPRGILVDQFGQLYVADSWNHRVMRWCLGANEGAIVVVGGNGQGEESNHLSYPIGLLFDLQSNLYVSDYGNHRIQKFEINLN